MTDSEQIQRIAAYEAMLWEAEGLLKSETRSRQDMARLRALTAALEAYYTGGDWMRDFEAEEAGLLPRDLPRGVLSEDGIDNLLEAFGELAELEPEPPIGTRILVLGCSGAGKSVFARRLQEKTGLPLIHLDNVWWKPDRTHITRAEFDRQLAEIVGGDAWILDGNYSRTYEPRIRASDTVIFLDYCQETCMQGIMERVGEARPDMPWTEQTLDPELVELVLTFRSEARPKLLALLEQYPEKRLLTFQTRAQADAWLEAL